MQSCLSRSCNREGSYYPCIDTVACNRARFSRSDKTAPRKGNMPNRKEDACGRCCFLPSRDRRRVSTAHFFYEEVKKSGLALYDKKVSSGFDQMRTPLTMLSLRGVTTGSQERNSVEMKKASCERRLSAIKGPLIISSSKPPTQPISERTPGWCVVERSRCNG
jgi:hypothetical protein